DINKYQGPEVDYGKSIGINRPVGCLWNEIVHKSQKRCGQEKCYSVMPIPPLYQGILNTGINRVTFESTDRQFQAIEYMEYGNCNKSGNIEPNGYIQMALSSF